MYETARKHRNETKLVECYEPFGKLVAGVLAGLEAKGQRPRIQEAWRSSDDQLRAYNSGHSKLKFGFHNATSPEGRPEALAVDILDEDAPLAPSSRFLLILATEARLRGLQTGILWGLNAVLQGGVNRAIFTGDFESALKIGWDPCHVEVAGLTPAQAKAGQRPSFGK